MASWGRALLLGFLVWLIPFVVSFLAFPLKESWRSLFESIMPLTLSLTVVPCAVLYLRRVQTALVKEGILLGVLWLVISVVIDLPLMLSPPLNYTLVEYVADIGLTYLMIPVITVGIALAASRNIGASKEVAELSTTAERPRE
jgi:hypothetical protein